MDGELATDGNLIFTNLVEMNFAYDNDNNLINQTISQYDKTYIKTYTYHDDNLINISLWVPL